MKEFNEKIIAWAVDRELDKKGTVEGQVVKTVEEMAELIIGISKDNIEVIKDSIGDVYVTLVIGNMLDYKEDIEDIYTEVKQRIDESKYVEDRKVVMLGLLTTAMEQTLSYFYQDHVIKQVLENLLEVAKFYELDFEECVEAAYKEIANRKGKTVNGTFVKEEDL